MTIIQNNKIIIPDYSLITSSADSIPIKAKGNILLEIEDCKTKVKKQLGESGIKEVETISVDSFNDKFVNNPNIQKDLDDGFIAERTSYGYLLKVNIASPSSVIDINSELFKNILLQTTSIYYNSHVNPMMPFELSNDLFSLIYDKIRLGLTVEIELDKEGNILSSKIYKSAIKNILMSNHYEFDRILREKAGTQLNKFNEHIKVLKEIGELFKNKRNINNGFSSSIDSQRKIGYNKLEPYEIGYVSSIVEEIMIKTNELVASFILENPEITGIFRNHMPEYKGKKFEGGEMQRALYDTEMKYHYGLLMDKYSHFTSPIRRAPDLLVHYGINDFLEGKSQTFEKNNLQNYLKQYLNPRQEFLINHTSSYNKKITEKQRKRQEKNKVINYIQKNPVNGENISKVSDFDLEINIYNYIKKNIEIPEYFSKELDNRFKSKNYNKELLFFLAFTKNEELIKLFNEFFNTNNMKNQFIEYFNDSDFISQNYNIEFIKSKYKKNNGKQQNGTKKFTGYTYFINKSNENIFINKNYETKSSAFKELIYFIINSEENFLK